MTVDLSDPRDLYGADVTGRHGEKLGKVETVYLDNQTQRPEWAAIKTGLFGIHISLVPLARADYQGGHLEVPYSKDDVQNAPHHDPGNELSVENEQQLFSHYGVDHGGDTATARTHDTPTGGADGAGAGRGERRGGTDRDEHDGAVGRDTSGPTTDEAMTRSEEELRVGTQTQERGRARLRKYVVTENVTQTVPVSHEEVRVEREPITEANAPAAHDGPSISEEEHEVVLHEERPVVGKETVAKERVRMDTETHRDEEQVSDEVRKEQIEATDETGATGRGTESTRPRR
ncbi:DUF2382 domain-containing protein [Actinomycetospora rhizophila]|uniref:DUF2382 domain-containing protein n=1 Tax=Actinomycetospora rhizophila TaxID=1416876 RepID=A0ABV9ZFW0_9PSEU